MARLSEIKSRIRSINSIRKITGAMELISNVKLQRQRNYMYRNREYNEALKEAVRQIVSSNREIDNVYLKEKQADRRFVIVFNSDMGLCGGYNINMLKLCQEKLRPKDIVYTCGKRNYEWLKNNTTLHNKEMIDSDTIIFEDLRGVMEEAMAMYVRDEISSIEIIFTKFVNNVTFTPVMERVLPCTIDYEETNEHVKETLFEPDPNTVLNQLIPMMAASDVYSKYLQSKASEHGARRFAMENANDNADELNEKLKLQYNQARQTAITQEITEIVGGANAL